MHIRTVSCSHFWRTYRLNIHFRSQAYIIIRLNVVETCYITIDGCNFITRQEHDHSVGGTAHVEGTESSPEGQRALILDDLGGAVGDACVWKFTSDRTRLHVLL